MIPHTLLADSIIIMLPEGPITRTREQFNFNSIVQVAKSGTIEDLRPLLTPVDCPNGVYHLYLGSTLYVNHAVTSTITTVLTLYRLQKGQFEQSSDLPSDAKYLGPYISFQAIQDNYLEFFI